MNVLLLHNRHRSASSGEDRVVDVEAAALRAAGHDVHTFESHSGAFKPVSARAAALPATILWNPEPYLALRRQLRRLRPDVVHVHNTYPLLSASVLGAAHAEGVPVVVTLHQYRLACPGGQLLRDGHYCNACVGGTGMLAVRHACYQGSLAKTVPVVAANLVNRRSWNVRPSAYIFLSRAQMREMSAMGVPPERCFVKWNLVPDVGSPPPVPEPGEYVAYLGRLVAAKGLEVLMRAWEQLDLPPDTLRLVIAGEGPLGPAVREWAGTQKGVDVLGGIPHDHSMRLLAGARAVVVPSKWREPFGLVAVEAKAIGSPVIASRHGALPEIVTDGVDGVLFTPERADELTAHLRDVATDPRRWAAMGDAARASYLRSHDPAANLDQLLAVYRYAIDHPS